MALHATAEQRVLDDPIPVRRIPGLRPVPAAASTVPRVPRMRLGVSVRNGDVRLGAGDVGGGSNTVKLEKVPRRGHTHHVGRTLQWFRKYGFLVAKVEKRALIIRPGMPKGMAMIGPSQDLFGVADVVAIPPAAYTGRKGTWYVQVCARGGGSAHRTKALAGVLDGVSVLPRLEAAGNRFLIVNYELGRTIPKGTRKDGRLIWTRRVEEFLSIPVGSENVPIVRCMFVDWSPVDFALVEGLPCVTRKSNSKAKGASAVPSASNVTESAASSLSSEILA